MPPLPDYFLWGYIMDKVFMKKLDAVDKLKMAITDLIAGISRKMLKKVTEPAMPGSNLFEKRRWSF